MIFTLQPVRMNIKKTMIIAIMLLCSLGSFAQAGLGDSQWKGKRVVFFGDSITDTSRIGTTKNYWKYLEEYMGIIPLVYGKNGNQSCDILTQMEKMKSTEKKEIDAIIIFIGTNDYNAGVPIGQWFEEKEDSVTISGPATAIRKHRFHCMDCNTFKGRLNIAVSTIKDEYPDKQLILLTPVHRGHAKFGENNIQPDEAFVNGIGLYINDYVNAIKETADIWAVPVIDLFAISGLYPSGESYSGCIANPHRDRLHPNAEGHRRIALALAYQLLGYPVF